MDRGQEAGPAGRRRTKGGRRDRGPLSRVLLSQDSGPPQRPTAWRPPAGTARGARGQPPALLCTVSSCGFQDAPSSAQVGPLGCLSPWKPVLPRPRGRQGLEWRQPLGATPIIRGPVSTEGPPSLGEPEAASPSQLGSKALSFPAWGRRVEISRIAISCSFPRSPSPLGHPEPCSWGLSGSSGAPGLSWGRRGAHASATPEPLSPVLRSGPTCSTGLGFLAEAGPCSPQPPGSPGPSSWNVPGVSLLQAPQETGHFLHPRSTRCARNPRANQARGRPCAEVPRWGLDAHGRSCRGGRGRTTGSASGPRAQTPELPHRQRFTADPARVAPGLAPPPGDTTLPPGCCAQDHPRTRGRRKPCGAEPRAMGKGAETGCRSGRASALGPRPHAHLALPASRYDAQGSAAAGEPLRAPPGWQHPQAAFLLRQCPAPPPQRFPLCFARGCLPPLL